jgi:hypothetical protein
VEQKTGVNFWESAGIGHIQITLTHWDDALEPAVAAGSVLEIGGSMFYADAEDDLDVAGAWGGIANDTQVYVYYGVSGTSTTQELSTTAPGWEDDLQGFYNAARTKRCPITIYKDAAGDYTQKTILLNRESGITYQGVNLGGSAANSDKIIRLATDASIVWDESEDEFVPNKGIKLYAYLDATSEQLAQQVNAGTSAAFVITKPTMVYYKTTCASPQYSNLLFGTVDGYVIMVETRILVGLTAYTCLALNPGSYKIYNSGNGTSTVYAQGVYGTIAVDDTLILE